MPTSEEILRSLSADNTRLESENARLKSERAEADDRLGRLCDLLFQHLPTTEPWSEEAWGLLESLAPQPADP